jgi:hypothetical protein
MQGPGTGTDYPFLDSPDAVQYLLGDLFLAYVDAGYALPFKVTQLTGFDTGGVERRDMIITDANDVVVIDTSTTSNYTDTAWGTNLRTLSWIDGPATLRCTMHTAGPPWDPGKTWDALITTNAVLDNRCLFRMPKTVTSLLVGDQVFTGNITLTEGFNVALTATPAPSNDGGRVTCQIDIEAEPGDGLGLVSGCEGVTPSIQQINNVAPAANGNFTLDAAGCYRGQRVVEVLSATPPEVALAAPNLSTADEGFYGVDLAQLRRFGNYATRTSLQEAMESTSTLQFFNDCSPCCTCDEFVATYEQMRALYYRYLAMGQRAEATRNLFASGIARWNAQKACRALQNLNLVLSSEPNSQLYVGALQCNMTAGCIRPLYMRTTFETFNNGSPTNMSSCAMLVAREEKIAGASTQYAEVSYTPSGNYPVLDTYFQSADPQGTSRYRMRILLCCNSNNQDVIRVTVTAHIANNAIRNTVTNQIIAPPTPITPPSSVTAIWSAHSAESLPPVRSMIIKSIPITQAGAS